jgi:hypothetical protein
MPSSSYRRRLRTTAVVQFSYNNTYTFTNTSNGICTKNSEKINIQNYFYKILDNIILYNDFTSNVHTIQTIISKTQDAADFYKLIEIIQHNLLSVVGNISDNTHSGIIQNRIDYIKTYIDQLPPDCAHLTPVSDMILQIIDSIVKTVDLSHVTTDINKIQLYIDDKYSDMLYIDKIQDNILSILCNIGQNVSSSIISERVQYLRQFIEHLK